MLQHSTKCIEILFLFRLLALILIRSSVRSLERRLSGLWSVLDLEASHGCGDNCDREHDEENIKDPHPNCANGNANNICDL